MAELSKQKRQEKQVRKSSSAPGQFLGYSLQVTRLLDRLLDAENDWVVSLEFFEDVGVESPEGMKIAEQDKSSLSGNPTADRSVSLWKTFSNWTDAIKCGDLDVNLTVFELYSTCQTHGEIVDIFSSATTESSVKKAIEDAKVKLNWGRVEQFPKDLFPLLSNFFSLEETKLLKLIENFHVLTPKISPYDDIKIKLAKLFCPDEIVDQVMEHALGWIKIRVDNLISSKKNAIIKKSEFRAEIISFIRAIDTRTILHSFAHKPQIDEINYELAIRTYVKQLDIVNFNDTIKMQAVIDYLLAATDRTEWSLKGYVNATSFIDYEDDLKRIWLNEKMINDIDNASLDESVKGQLLCLNCLKKHEKIQGLEVPLHFTAGSFHALADSQLIGWHSDFENELSKDLK